MIADIIVDIPWLKHNETLAYEVPDSLKDKIKVGSLVSIPVKANLKIGIVKNLRGRETCQIPNIRPLNDVHPVTLTEHQIKLGEFISKHYLCSLYRAHKLMLPSSMRKGNFAIQEEHHITLTCSKDEALDYINKNKRSKKQHALINLLLTKKHISHNDRTAHNIPKSIFTTLQEKGMITEKIIEETFEIAPIDYIQPPLEKKRILYFGGPQKRREKYVQHINQALREGKQALILCPELALTEHLGSHLEKVFGPKVIVLHGKLSEKQRRTAWKHITDLKSGVIVGSRTSLFYPYKNLGCIIVDEEHTWSYKSDQSPRYHTVETVLEHFKDDTTVILGSATPQLSTMHHFKDHHMETLQSKTYVAPYIVDLREELKKGNYTLFGDDLAATIHERLSNNEQNLLIMNRLGNALSVQCRDCGATCQCPRCKIPLTVYQQNTHTLRCHHCNYRTQYVKACTTCGSIRVKEFGAGCNAVYKSAKDTFPSANVMLVTSETLNNHEQLSDLTRKMQAADIIVGTNVIAKGFDLPRLTLSVIMLADMTLNFPDLMSTERAYQLFVNAQELLQATKKQFVIQTYQPEHPVIESLLEGSPQKAYYKYVLDELHERAMMNYPPYTKVGRLNISHYNESQAESLASELAEKIKRKAVKLDIEAVVNVAQNMIYRKKGNYNWHVSVRSEKPQLLLAGLRPSKAKPFTVDITPVGGA